MKRGWGSRRKRKLGQRDSTLGDQKAWLEPREYVESKLEREVGERLLRALWAG